MKFINNFQSLIHTNDFDFIILASYNFLINTHRHESGQLRIVKTLVDSESFGIRGIDEISKS